MAKKQFAQNKRSRYFWTLFIVIIISSIFVNISVPFSLNEGNFNQFNFLKPNSGEISIITPENETISKPSKGYYPGTLGFDDISGTNLPSYCSFSLGGTGANPNHCYAEIVASKTDTSGNTHNNVLTIRDYGSGSLGRARADFLPVGSSDARNCTIEFYNLINKDSGTLYRSNFAIQGDLGPIANFRWYKYSSSGNPDLLYYDGNDYVNTGIDQTYNQWYRYSVDISCDGGYAGLGGNQWRFRAYEQDGNLVYSSGVIDFQVDHPTGGAYRYETSSSESQNAISQYVDAIGVTGLQDGYQIGDNLNEGILVSYESNTEYNWTGYSLDKGQNITILGNTTIKVPTYGVHSIQISGISLETHYQSNIRYFTIRKDTISLITPYNITYTSPDNGYYPGTIGFDDTSGITLPSYCSFSLGGTGADLNHCYAEIVASKTDASGNTHNNVLTIRDYGSGSLGRARADFLPVGSSDARNCTIEFYNLINKDSGTLYRSNFAIQGDLGPIANFRWYKYSSSGNPDLLYYDGNDYVNTGIDQTYNQWYRYSVDISCDGGYAGLGGNQWRFRAYDQDGNLIYSSGVIDFQVDHPTGGAYRYETSSSESQNAISQYVDAIGVTGLQDGYQIGDNLNEGILVSYENNTEYNWTGYSLDKGQNITILGNTIISKPENGIHSIQIFAEDSLGDIYNSNLRYFNVNYTLDDGNYRYMIPGARKPINLTSLHGVVIEYNVSSKAYITVKRQPHKFPALSLIDKNVNTCYFYNITAYDINKNVDNSMIIGLHIRFYYNPDLIKAPEKLRIYHYNEVANLWEWEIAAIINTEFSYIEFSTSSLSYFCLAEFEPFVPPTLQFFELLFFIIFLSIVAVSVPSTYTLISRRKKKKKLEGESSTHSNLKGNKKKESIIEHKIRVKFVRKQLNNIPKNEKEPSKIENISKSVEARRDITELLEVERTESEMNIYEQEEICQVHKGPLLGLSYHCPKCKTKYCVKCAMALLNSDDKCWTCKTPIKLGSEFKNIELNKEELQDPSTHNKLHEIFERKNAIEKLSSMRDLNISLLSEDFLEKVDQFEWEPEDKRIFIKEMIGLSNEEREIILNEMIQYKNNEQLESW